MSEKFVVLLTLLHQLPLLVFQIVLSETDIKFFIQFASFFRELCSEIYQRFYLEQRILSSHVETRIYVRHLKLKYQN